MNAEHPNPPSGSQDPTPSQNPVAPTGPVDFTEHGPSILDDEDDADKAKEPTPEEKEERQLFDNCRRLASVIMEETPMKARHGRSVFTSEYVAGRTIPDRIDEGHDKEYDERNVQIQYSDKHIRPDRPDYLIRSFPITNNSTFTGLSISLYQYRPELKNYPNSFDTTIELELHILHTQREDTNICFDLSTSGRITIKRNADGDHGEFTDHVERMTKLQELYEILSDLQANLPRDDTVSETLENPDSTPSNPPDNLVE